MDWAKIKEILAVIVEYFKEVFKYFGYLPKDEEVTE